MHLNELTLAGSWLSNPHRSSSKGRGSITQAASSDSTSLSNATSSNLTESIEQAITDSLVYKLFSAIARVNDEQSAEFFDSKFTASFTSRESSNVLSLDSFSVTQFSKQNISAVFSDTGFSLDVSASSSQLSQFNFFSSRTDSELVFSTSTFIQLSLTLEVEQQQSDPLIIDLDFNGFNFSSTNAINNFDINADGQLDSVTNLQGQDSFIAIDLNQNGQIDNGLELFGDSGGAQNGFIDLQRFDNNKDSQITAEDRVYDQLLLLRFSSSGAQEISSLSNRVASIDLAANQQNVDYGKNNTLIAASTFKDVKGNQGQIGDFLLGINASSISTSLIDNSIE